MDELQPKDNKNIGKIDVRSIAKREMAKLTE